MVEGRAREAQEPERSGPSAVDAGDAPQEPHGRVDHEHHIDDRARADRRHDRNLPGGAGDRALGLRVEGREQFPLRDRQPILGVEDFAR
jgi:hypothetical protein